MHDTYRLCRSAAAWGVRFYRDHFWLVFGLSLVPTLQRFLVIRIGLPAPLAIGSEILVALVRVGLVVAIVRLLLGELGTAGIGRTEAWARLKGGLRFRRTAFWLQWVILALAFVVFDIIPTVLIALFVPEDARNLVTATLVAVKNPTVIAFTLLWMAGIAYSLIVNPAGRNLSTGGHCHADEDRQLHYGTRE